jgi:siroheme synthase-like protein
MPGYPIELDLTGRVVVVVGLGAVGRRRVAGLLAAGARVEGVDPAPRVVPDGITLHAEPYRPQHLQGAALVLAAATPAVNRQVVADARAAGLWVCSASAAAGDFRVPAVWREGGVLLTVSTAGASPALAGALRDRAAAALGPAAAGLAATLAGLRPLMFARLADPEARRRVLADWADPRWLALFDAGGAEAVRAEVVRRIEAGLPEKTP